MKALHILLLSAAFSILSFNVTHGEKIINGMKARKNSLQYMVSVQWNGTHKCGGFLIHPCYVLTAAHCRMHSDLSVVIGTHDINPSRNNLRRHIVQSMHSYPAYKKDPIDGYDIMLLKLSERVDLNDDVKTIDIPSRNNWIYMPCQVAGWGQNESGEIADDLMVTEVPIISTDVCRKEWWKKNIQLPNNILCAGGYQTTHGACQGDSGGPLVCNGVAVGIVSFNYKQNCSYPNVPNVYTDISSYTDWIYNVIHGHA